MKKTILIFMCFALLFTGCSAPKKADNEPESENHLIEESEEPEIEFTSKIQSDECMLCGDSEQPSLLPLYKGQINVGIIDLNTFDVCNLKMNRYDDYGNLIEEKAGNSSTMINSYGENGMSVYYHANTDRGYTSGSVSFPKDNELNVKEVEELLCDACFNKIYEEAWSNSPYSVGVIDFSNMEVRLFEENITGFTFGDYYLDLDYRKLDDEDERIDINILAFYCPQRYE